MPELVAVDYDPFAGQQPQEENLYWHHRGELAGGGVLQPTGERSTLYQAALEGPGGRSYNVPTVWDGQILTTGEARDRAAAAPGGMHAWPSYATPDAADLAYEARVHPRAAADVDRFEYLHAPFPSAAEVRGREIMQPGRDAITPLLPASDPNLAAPYDRSKSFAGNALDPSRIENSMGVALGFSGGGLATRNAGSMLDRINALSKDRLAAEAGGRAAGSPARSFSEIERGQDRGYDIVKAGEPIGSIRMSMPADGTAYVDSITAGKIGETNPLGPRAVRDLTRQFFEANPHVDELQGWRVSGARAATGSGEDLLSITRDQAMGGRQVIRDPGMLELVRKYGLAALGLPAGAAALIPVDHDPQF